jgi:hypothetical protein
VSDTVHVFRPEEYFIQDEPYYQPVGDEIAVFEAALALASPLSVGHAAGVHLRVFAARLSSLRRRYALPFIAFVTDGVSVCRKLKHIGEPTDSQRPVSVCCCLSSSAC